MSRGEDGVRGATAADLAEPEGLYRVANDGLTRFRRADRIARRSVPLAIARRVPLVGQQVQAVRTMTSTAVTVGQIGADAARAVQARLDDAGGAAGRVALLDTATAEVSKARARLAEVEVRKGSWVLPPFSGARDRLAASLDTARAKLDEAAVMAGALRKMFVGSRVLILAGNNAEMRAGPMPLSAGVAELKDGGIEVGEFVPTHSLYRGQGSIVPHPKELDDLYGWMVIGAEWRATTATPNFPASGAMYKQMAVKSGLGEVDTVMFVDAASLRAVVAATGPVEVDGRRYTTKNIEREILNENYMRFATADLPTLTERYDLQSQIGVAVFDALNSRSLDLGELVANLSDAGKGRHILAWSIDPGLQMVWQRAGIDGAVHRDNFMVALQNISANKLDYYIRPRVTLRTLWVRRGYRRVEMNVYFENKKRTRTSDVIEGIAYNRTQGMADGEHRVYLVAYLPHAAVDVASADPPFTNAGTDAGMKVVGFRYGVKVGESRTVTITFTVPKNQLFHVIPSARYRPMQYVTPDAAFTDAEPVVLKL